MNFFALLLPDTTIFEISYQPFTPSLIGGIGQRKLLKNDVCSKSYTRKFLYYNNIPVSRAASAEICQVCQGVETLTKLILTVNGKFSNG